MDHPISFRRPKEVLLIGRKQVDFSREQKNVDIIVTLILFVILTLGTVPNNLEKRMGELEILRRIATIQTIALLKIGLNTWKTAIGIKRFAVHQVEDHHFQHNLLYCRRLIICKIALRRKKGVMWYYLLI